MRNRDYQLYICFFTWLVDLVISASRRDVTTNTAKSISPTVLGNPNFVVDDRVERVLEGGKAFKTRRLEDGAWRVIVVQDVHAPNHLIWDRLLSFEDYPQLISRVVSAENYITSKSKSTKNKFEGLSMDRQDFSTQFIVKKSLPWWARIFCPFQPSEDSPTMAISIKHSYSPTHNILTLGLDHDRHPKTGGMSFLEDMTGMWYVFPHPRRENWSRVTFTARIRIFQQGQNILPDFVTYYLLSNSFLTDFTAWLKDISESDYAHQSRVAHDVINAAQNQIIQEYGEPLNTTSMVCIPGNGGFSCRYAGGLAHETKQSASPVGLLRYILVVLFSLLASANVYLCLDHTFR